jgi:hypothetical protein
MRVCGARSILALSMAMAGTAAWPAGATARPPTRTLVFDSLVHNRFVDRPPAGPSVGDTELASAKLRDASGRVVGTASDTCVFTKMLADDVLERCTGEARTSDGTVTLAGTGRLHAMNPPWRVTGRSGAYEGLRGTQVFATDIPLDPDVPVAAGRLFSVAVIEVRTDRRLHAGVVPRPPANAAFVQRANRICRATEATARRQPGFPFPSFDPFHPDPALLPQVGRFFDQPARHRLPRALLRELERLRGPPASVRAWRKVLERRRTLLANEDAQIAAALAADAPAFVRTVYRQSKDYNGLVFASAVFGVQSCTFS